MHVDPMERPLPTVLAVVAAASAPALTAAGQKQDTDLSRDEENADTITGNLERQRELESIFDDWRVPPWLESARDARDKLLDMIHLDIGASYYVAGLAAYGGLEEVSGVSGDLTVEGTWQLLGPRVDRPLDLFFRVRDRHRLGSRAASEVAGDSGGVIWNFTSGFSAAGLAPVKRAGGMKARSRGGRRNP